MSKILIIGCVSLDTIHLEQIDGGQTHSTIGGAALFTALAAAHQGAEVTLYAPKPSPMPRTLLAIDKAVNWIGPQVDPDKMPTLQITHHGEGRATLVGASWGPEHLLTPENLKATLTLSAKGESTYDAIHIAALSTAKRQLEFLHFLIDAGLSNLMSVGTYARCINNDRTTVQKLLAECNVFFMNSNEAALLESDLPTDGKAEGKGEEKQQSLTPGIGQLVFITDGKNGATVISRDFVQSIEATPATELDPTGAGDTFCGATLAGLCNHLSAIDSARLGAVLAAKVIEYPGSAYYLDRRSD